MSEQYVGWYGKGRHQDWRTPPELFAKFHAKYHFSLDGAADKDNALLPVASTIEQPLSWEGHRVFCNPPWSDIRSFVELAPSADFAVLLVPARTNAKWFHRALELGATPAFFLGRPKFVGRPSVANSPVDCLLLVFGQ